MFHHPEQFLGPSLSKNNCSYVDMSVFNCHRDSEGMADSVWRRKPVRSWPALRMQTVSQTLWARASVSADGASGKDTM